MCPWSSVNYQGTPPAPFTVGEFWCFRKIHVQGGSLERQTNMMRVIHFLLVLDWENLVLKHPKNLEKELDAITDDATRNADQVPLSPPDWNLADEHGSTRQNYLESIVKEVKEDICWNIRPSYEHIVERIAKATGEVSIDPKARFKSRRWILSWNRSCKTLREARGEPDNPFASI
ncbi:MAG: hypothetical protein LQ352_001936 [Teloschistes flavicans]|nr:MAG: hypothetical protein LQ352_001936 [Teloschistes flavicans]